MPRSAVRVLALVLALASARLVAPWWCGLGAEAWYRGDADLQMSMADDLVAFERRDDPRAAVNAPSEDRFAGEWALITHQMVTLGLAQMCLQHPELRGRYAAEVTRAAIKTFQPHIRDFGTRAWAGEDVMASLASPHGHAYFGYGVLALSVARLLDPRFPPDIAAKHDALIAAYERRLLAAPAGLIETYPGETYPTDNAAIAGAIAVHGRVTGVSHGTVLRHWAAAVRTRQIDPATGLVWQRMGLDGSHLDAPRASGTAMAAYFAGFVDRSIAERLSAGVLANETSFAGFDAIREYGAGHAVPADVDSGPVVFGVAVTATGVALASARAFGRKDSFERIYRTVDLFGMPATWAGRTRFATGGPVGNAVLFALLTSGPEVADSNSRGEPE